MNCDEIFVPKSQAYIASVLAERQQFQQRLQRAQRSQAEYGKLFRKLNIIIDQLKEKFPHGSRHLVGSHDYETTSNRSGTTSPSSRSSSCGGVGLKRKSCHMESGFFDGFDGVDEEEEREEKISGRASNVLQDYPKRVERNEDGEAVVILGPNGTCVPAQHFDEIVWQTSAAATRSLLALVFTNDILATHTLTGKPSPAFHGRERPPKMQLDAAKTADIIHCVRTQCGSNEREVRAAITTKCADTAKKYKRRLLRQLQK